MVKTLSTLTLASALSLGTAQAADVTVERTLRAPIDRVWQSFSAFCSIQNWQSLVETCDVYENRHGIHRTVVMTDGSVFVERLSEFSDRDNTFTYTILIGPLGLQDYQATLDFDPITVGSTHLTWWASFDIEPELEQEMIETLTLLFNNGVDGMERMLRPPRHGHPRQSHPRRR